MQIIPKELIDDLYSRTGITLSWSELAEIAGLKKQMINQYKDKALPLHASQKIALYFSKYSCKTNSLIKLSDKKSLEAFKKFGNRIMQIQEKNNLSNKEMADIIGVSEAGYIKLCTGSKFPTEKELNNIKANFDVDIDWLMYGNSYAHTFQCKDEKKSLSLTSEEIAKLKNLLNNI